MLRDIRAIGISARGLQAPPVEKPSTLAFSPPITIEYSENSLYVSPIRAVGMYIKVGKPSTLSIKILGVAIGDVVEIHGSCHCGRVQFKAQVNPGWVFVCHCTDCQQLSGSAFRVGVAASDDSFTLLGEPPTKYVCTADSGVERIRAFCPHCGTPIYAADVSDLRYLMIPVTTTRQKDELKPKVQLWCQSALSWINQLQAIEGTAKQPGMPR